MECGWWGVWGVVRRSCGGPVSVRLLVMAYVQVRKSRAGWVSGYQVRWRECGGRAGREQSEFFDDAESAGVFRDAVNEAGQRWPVGWIKGWGFAGDGDLVEERYRFRTFARRCIENRTGIEERTRRDYRQDLETWILPTFGECDVRSTAHFCSATVRAWVRGLEQTRMPRGRGTDAHAVGRTMSPKTMRNLHGLLSSILNEAVRAEPPLRARNPCALTRLPRRDDEIDESANFLTPREVAALSRAFTMRQDQLLVMVAYGTGLRWGEVTALQPGDVVDPWSARPRVRVQRAWKRDADGGYFLGKPKTKRSRRMVRISSSVRAALVELGLHERDRDALLFTGAKANQRLHYSTFGDRWGRAVRRAQQAGGLDKVPTPHDLRHSHAAALISAGHSLTYVQRRLGHESIKTTSDLYGHLLPEADDDAMVSIETALSGTSPLLRTVS